MTSVEFYKSIQYISLMEAVSKYISIFEPFGHNVLEILDRVGGLTLDSCFFLNEYELFCASKLKFNENVH